ncbi:MAG: hypothetical protein ABFR97_01360 [Thermodesulfobacteriota bacterium]
MSDAANRLETEFAEIQHHFANHPKISILASEGTPPERYELEYRLNGFAQIDNGEPVQSDQHRIEISLSFGFPHFPPNCKPLTSIFHPDIDPSAIKIADFWSHDKRLVDLIIHIAKMISWQVFSDENVFNPAALQWAGENGSAIPVDDYAFELAADLDSSGMNLESATQADNLPEDEDISELPEIDFAAVDLNPDSGPAAAQGLAARETASPAANEDDLPDIEFQSDALAGLGTEPAADTAGGDDLLADIDFQVTSEDTSMRLDLGGDGAPGPGEVSGNDPGGSDEMHLDLEPGGGEPAPDIVIEKLTVADPTYDSYGDDEIDLDLGDVDVDLDILTSMLDQRNFYAARKKVQATAELSPAMAAAVPTINETIAAAEKVHAEAIGFEEQGLVERSAGRLDDVMEMISDYPGLEADRQRVKDAWVGLDQGGASADIGLTMESGTIPPPPADGGLGITASAPPPATPTPAAEENAPPPPPPKRKKKLKPVKKKSPSPPGQKKGRSAIFGFFVLLLIILGALWAGYEWRSYAKAEQIWATMNSLLEAEDFDKVKANSLEIKKSLEPIWVFKARGKKVLLAKVDDLLTSEEFREGIEGKTLYQGKHISKRAHRVYLKIEELVGDGAAYKEAGELKKSLAAYEGALKVSQDNKKRLEAKKVAEVELLVLQARFANLISIGKDYFTAANWPQAIATFEQALELSKTEGVAESVKGHDVHRYLQRARFSQLVVEGDLLQKEGKWAEAEKKYSAAQKISQEKNIIEPARAAEVTTKKAQSLLLQTRAAGDRLLSGKKWQEAHKEFSTAAKAVQGGVSLPGKSQAETERVIMSSLLSSQVKMEQQRAEGYLQKESYSKARDSLRRIVSAIDKSAFADRPDMQKLRRATTDKIRETELAVVIEEKTAYLLENYKEIFTKNFTGVRPTALSKPQVDFLEKVDDNLIFRIRCREKQAVKYFKLELVYQYDMLLSQWGFPKRR